MQGQEQRVLPPVAERREMDVHHSETVIQIFAKPVPADGRFQVHIGRGNDTSVDTEGLVPPDPLERPLL